MGEFGMVRLWDIQIAEIIAIYLYAMGKIGKMNHKAIQRPQGYEADDSNDSHGLNPHVMAK